MSADKMWADTTARRVSAESRTVGYKRVEVMSQAHHVRIAGGVDQSGNHRIKSGVSMADILGVNWSANVGRRCA
jgi:hypothetical protein